MLVLCAISDFVIMTVIVTATIAHLIWGSPNPYHPMDDVNAKSPSLPFSGPHKVEAEESPWASNGLGLP